MDADATCDVLRDDLKAAVANAHPGQLVETIETHISWVFLCGQLAYKVKKPVDLGFADFSTLEKRRFFCEEELRLNRRLAADVYLGVDRFVRSPSGGLMLGGEQQADGSGEVVEYAVRMQRFSQQAILAEALAAGAVTPGMIDELAAAIAAFHGQCAVAAADGTWGEPQGIARRVKQVLDEVANIAPRLDRGNEVLRLRDWLDAEFVSLETTFRRRRLDGKVREGHGDLHSGNMVLLHDKIAVFDCIDFNPDLRFIDVLSDVAFAVMDFEHRGRRDLAFRFLNVYLEQSGDYEGLAVLRYYLVYRALVRAAVAGIRLRQELSSHDSRFAADAEQQCRQAIQYVDLAVKYSRQSAEFLAITHGPSGSGKSTFARRLSEEHGAMQLRSDVERRRRYADSRGRYSSAATQWTYQRLAEAAETSIRAGFAAVADATFLSHRRRAEFRGLAQRLGAPFLILDLQTPRDVLLEHVAARAARGDDASEADESVLRSQLASAEPLREEELEFAVCVPTTANDAVGEMLRGVCDALQRNASNHS